MTPDFSGSTKPLQIMLKNLSGPLTFSVSLMIAAALHAAPPLIVSHSGSMELKEGSAFAARVVALGENLGYQWFRDEQPIIGETSDTLLLDTISQAQAGDYHVVVSNPDGTDVSEPVALDVTAASALGVAPGGRGIVSVPGHLAYYDLYLPTAYANSRHIPPVLFTLDPGGGGMVGHFRNVAEEKGWIVVGIAQSRNTQGSQLKMLFSRAVMQHVLDNLRVDPNRIFVAGMSGGGWASFDAAKIDAPLVAGVFSMGGWLGNQYSTRRDIYLSGLLVARANGDNDTGANFYMASDRNYLTRWTFNDNIKDWSFPGGHVSAPEPVQREVFDWLISGTTSSTSAARNLARTQEALWKARITAGEVHQVFRETVDAAFNQPRTPVALAAWRTMDFLFSRTDCFLREAPPDFSGFPLRNFLALHVHHALYAFMQQRDPSRLFSGVAAARALGAHFEAVQVIPLAETRTILRHPPHSFFDGFILENALHDREALPLFGDWDGDGNDNFSEFVLGSSPLVADTLPVPGIHRFGHQAYAVMPRSRGDLTLRLAAEATDNPAWGWWVETPVADGWWKPAADGTRMLTKRVADLRNQPRQLVRFSASPDPNLWRDANQDGIPLDYQFPDWDLTGLPQDGNSADLPDARQSTEVPGGAPLYLRYLTAAEIGPLQDRGPSLRYHPALAGYRGYLYHEVWMNVPGSSIASATSVIASRPPNDVRLIPSSEAPWFAVDGASIMGDNYFERSRGYLIPDVSGNYVFSIAGDDQCELWLSTGTRVGNAVRIAHATQWTGYRNYTQTSSQTSAPIPLVAGNRYYLEILHKEGSGGDHCSVAWIVPGSSERVIIPSANLACLPLNLIAGPGF